VSGWRKSSHSGTNGCVEVWVKSSHSVTNGCVEVGVARTSSHSHSGSCVEVEGLPGLDAAPDGSPYVVAVRNSLRPDRGTVHFTAREWTAFLAGVGGGEFDLV
jgi:hypothetical protein